MKALLLLCASAALVHLAASYDGYLKLKVPKHYPPLDSNDYIYIIIIFHIDALDKLYNALENAKSSVPPLTDITVYISKDWHPPNKNIPTVPVDVSSPDAALDTLNAFVESKSSGKITKLVTGVTSHTAAIILNVINALKVPSPGGTGWTKLLDGEYKKVENTDLGVTLIEIPYSVYVSILYAIPSAGKVEAVGQSLIPATIEALRKSLTLQSVKVEVPRATLYTGFFMAVEKEGELDSTTYGYKVSAQFP